MIRRPTIFVAGQDKPSVSKYTKDTQSETTMFTSSVTGTGPPQMVVNHCLQSHRVRRYRLQTQFTMYPERVEPSTS